MSIARQTNSFNFEESTFIKFENEVSFYAKSTILSNTNKYRTMMRYLNLYQNHTCQNGEDDSIYYIEYIIDCFQDIISENITDDFYDIISKFVPVFNYSTLSILSNINNIQDKLREQVNTALLINSHIFYHN